MFSQNHSKEWTSTVHTFFYEYNDGHPSWKEFEISPCLNRINRLFLLLTLEVSYSQLVHYNLEVAKNSIRSAIAGIAGVSPLRITDLFVSTMICCFAISTLEIFTLIEINCMLIF